MSKLESYVRMGVDVGKKKKVLIMKTGHSELLEPSHGPVVSLGDVLISTSLLHLYPPETHDVTWVADACALPLLQDNESVKKLLTIQNPVWKKELAGKAFDIVVNLEKGEEFDAVAKQTLARESYGFFIEEKGLAVHCDNQDVLHAGRDVSVRKKLGKSWNDYLFEIVGSRYAGQPSMLGYSPKTQVVHDIGFNFKVGSKWPHKAWPTSHWNELQLLLGNEYSISWQESLNDLLGYIDWIHSCRMLVTNDSLGLHIAHALGKKVVALFGPTLSTDLADNDMVRILKPQVLWACLPCMEKSCPFDRSCMAHISPSSVADAVDELFGNARLENLTQRACAAS